MKHKKLLWIAGVLTLIIVVLFVCNFVGKENTKSTKALLPADEKISEKLGSDFGELYNKILSIVTNDRKLEERDTAQEYIIVNDESFLGIEYINIKVFADGTGEIIHKFYKNGLLGNGEFTIDETFTLKEEQVAQVVKVFEDNNFWEIPSQHPEGRFGLDGNVIFIEGINENQYNIIHMWCPDEKYEIKKIYDAIFSFVDVCRSVNKQ